MSDLRRRETGAACAHPPIAELRHLSCSTCHAFKLTGSPREIRGDVIAALASYAYEGRRVVSVTIEADDG